MWQGRLNWQYFLSKFHLHEHEARPLSLTSFTVAVGAARFTSGSGSAKRIFPLSQLYRYGFIWKYRLVHVLCFKSGRMILRPLHSSRGFAPPDRLSWLADHLRSVICTKGSSKHDVSVVQGFANSRLCCFISKGKWVTQIQHNMRKHKLPPPKPKMPTPNALKSRILISDLSTMTLRPLNPEP